MANKKNISAVFNPVSTSGIGFKLEHYIQASYLASSMLEIPVPFGNGVTVKELKFQAKLVADTDDLIVYFSDQTIHLVQSKKGFEINSNKTFYEVIDYLWKDFNKDGFDKIHSKFIITTDILSKTDVDHGLLVLEWARFSKDFDDFYTKLNANQQKHTKYKHFIKAIEKTNGALADDDLVFDFLKTLFIETYDYLDNGSKDKEVLKWYLQPFLKAGNNSENSLLALLDYVQFCNYYGGTINKSNVDKKIKKLFDLSKSSLIGSELSELIKKSKSQLQYTIQNDIGGYHIDRSEQISQVQQKLTENRIVIISGEGGVGKSGLAKDFFNKTYNYEVGYLVFKADQLDKTSLAHALAHIGIYSDFETLLSQWILLPRLMIYIDSFEKLYESENKEAFLEFLGKINQVNNVKVIVACRSYALETLRIKFRIPKSDIGIVELLPLTEEQLKEVAKHKEKLRKLIANPKLKGLISLPFYLSIALQVIDSLDDEEELSEHEFKRALWGLTVEKKGSVKSGTSKKRKDVFSSIVLKRAIEKSPYIKADANADVDIIAELEKDGLLIKHPKFDTYFPAHDIFEDMVVINYLNECFRNKGNSDQFIRSIDTNPVFRRGTRLWIQELISDQPDDAKIFLSEIFPLYSDSPIIDEILIGILGSNQAYSLITQNVDLFLKGNLKLFFRSFHLLKVAYTEPFEGDHPERKIKSVGHGWTALLKIMDEHFNENTAAFNVVRMDLLRHWTLQFNQDAFIPIEGAIVARHALQMFKEDKESFRFDSKKRILEILFFVVFYAKDETEKILRGAILARKTKSSTTDYRISFYRDLFKMLLVETFRCVNIYKLFPEFIIELSKTEWYKNIRVDPEDYYDTNYLESSFGLTEYPYKYFSASGYQTPFRYLFRYHPSLALQFLIELCNRSIEIYIHSKYAQQSQTKQIAIKLKEGTEVLLYGDYTLWGTYRGFGTSPCLLQSALMAFETYLLDAAESDSLSTDLFDQVLTESNSVLVPSVLASIAMAYPLIFKEKIFALLSNREFFAWDLSRYGSEFGVQHTNIGNEYFYIRERYLSNELKHRKKNLEYLMKVLQFYYPQQISELIESYKSKTDPNDLVWQLALVRMDIRNTTTEIRDDENVILFKPNPLPKHLQEFINEGEDDRNEDSRAISIFLWAEKAFAEEDQVLLTYEIWKENYHKLLKLKRSTHLLDSRKKMAAIGIKHFAAHLKKEEKEFCTKIILHVLKHFLRQLKVGNSYSTLDIINDSIFSVVPLLFKKEFEEYVDKDLFKTTLTDLIILLPKDKKKYLVDGVREFLWNFDKQMAYECFQTLLKFSTNQRLWYEIQKWRNLPNKKIIQNINSYLIRIKTTSYVQPEDIDLKNHDLYNILQALQCIPYNLLNEEYREYLCTILVQILSAEDLDDQKDYEFIQGMQILFGNYFINNTDENSIKTLLQLLSLRTKQFKFMMDTLKRFVWIGHDTQYPESLWFHLNVIMQYVINESPTIGFVHVILLEPLKNIERCNKVPEKGTGRVLHEKIISEFASDKNLIEAVFKLLAGAGSTYQPVCLTWLMKSLPDKKSYEDSIGIFFNSKYMDQFIQQLYNNNLEHIQRNAEQHSYFIMLLNLLIDRGSTLAFRIRDELI